MSLPATYDYYVYFKLGKFQLVPAAKPPTLTPVTGLNIGNYRDFGEGTLVTGQAILAKTDEATGNGTVGANLPTGAGANVESYPDDIAHIPPRQEITAKDFWVFKDADDKLLAQPLVVDVLMFSPYPPNTVAPTVLLGGYSGSGTPEGVVTAPQYSIFTRTDGGQGTKLYVKTTTTGNTGWVAV